MDDKKYYDKHYKNNFKNSRRLNHKILRYFENKLLSKIGIHFKNRSIELGCGSGQNIKILKQYNPTFDIIGVDNSTMAIKYAKKYYGDYFYVGDAMNTHYKNESFNTVFIRDLFHHVDHVSLLIEEAIRITKNKIIIIEPNIKNFQVKIISKLFKIERGLRTMDLNKIKKEVASRGFSCVDDYYDEHNIKMSIYLLCSIKSFYKIFNYLSILILPPLVLINMIWNCLSYKTGSYRVMIFQRR